MSSDISITPLNHALRQRGLKTTELERLPILLEASKNDPSPTIVDLLRENGRLREEVAYHQELSRALMGILESTKRARCILDEALLEVGYFLDSTSAVNALKEKATFAYKVLKEGLKESSHKIYASECRLLDFFGITLDETEGRDFSVI
jgi:hypothetical protein